MAEKLDSKKIADFKELLLINVFEIQAPINLGFLWTGAGILTYIGKGGKISWGDKI